MPEQYGFGDSTTEPTRLRQSNKGGDQMNQKDDEVAHCGNDIKTRQALDFGPLLEFAKNKCSGHNTRIQEVGPDWRAAALNVQLDDHTPGTAAATGLDPAMGLKSDLHRKLDHAGFGG